MHIERIGDTVDLLGESCVWSIKEEALYWVDIRGKMLRRLDHRAGRTDSFPLPEMAGSIALRRTGGLLVAMQSDISWFEPRSGTWQPVARPSESVPNQRFNDGRCDRQGRFWTGTIDHAGRGPCGTLYRLGPDRVLVPVLRHVTIPNSLAWSPDGTTMYFSDTTSHTITAYDFDIASGTPSRQREFARTTPPATPDGSTVDAEGCLWNAEYDGWRVVRYAPDGRVDRVIELPVKRPTCCAFGGPGLATLFVTTASQRLTEEEHAAQPLAGCLLALDVGVCGMPEPSYLD
jgi:sugar lactone lactonase YvrE